MTGEQDGMGRGTGVRTYRELLGAGHRAGVLPDGAADRAEVVFNLSRAHTRMSADFDALHRGLGWTWAGFRIMNVLWALGDVDMRELARLSGASRAAISSALNALERDGLVDRVRDARDRRLVTVHLTGHGERDLEAGMRAQAAREAEWFADLDAEDVRRLGALLARIADRREGRSRD